MNQGPHSHDSPPLPAALCRFDAEARDATTEAHALLGDRLCRAAVQVLAVDSAAISVFLGPDVCIPVGASDDGAAFAERLHFSTGEGPCLQAYLTRRPVLVPDVQDLESEARAAWPIYVAHLSGRTTYQQVAAFPMLVHDSVLGVFSLYRRQIGAELDLGVITLVIAWTTRRLLGVDVATYRSPESEALWLDTSTARRRIVWQAQGIVMRTHGMDPRRALNLLRARALASQRLVDEVAEDVVQGGLP